MSVSTPPRHPHFYQLHSRLGLINVPHGGTAPNLGVEEGPTALISQLRKQLASPDSLHSYSFPLPETIEAATYFEELAHHSHQARKLITTTLQPHQSMIALGGDHSISYASLQAVLERQGVEDCGLLIFDSHADLHQPSTSPSGNFHGMWLRPFLDGFEVAELDAAVPQKLLPQQVLFVGNLLTEPAEQEFISSQGIANISHVDTAAERRLEQFLSTYRHIHVSFDIDVFRSAYAPGIGTPNPTGLTPAQVWPILRLIQTHPSVSLDMVEVNPTREGSERTVLLGARVIQELLR